MSKTIDETLTQRGNKYGDFYEHARISQNIKAAMVDSPNCNCEAMIKGFRDE